MDQFTQNELQLISMVVGNRATEVRKFVETHEYTSELCKAEDVRYAADLQKLADKASSLQS